MAKKVNDLLAALGSPDEPADHKIQEVPLRSLGVQPSVVPMRVEPKTFSQNKRKKDTGGILYLTLTLEEDESLRHLCYRTKRSRAEVGREALRDIFEKYQFTS